MLYIRSINIQNSVYVAENCVVAKKHLTEKAADCTINQQRYAMQK